MLIKDYENKKQYREALRKQYEENRKEEPRKI